MMNNKNMTLDIKQTLMSNVVFLLLLSLVVGYFIALVEYAKTLEPTLTFVVLVLLVFTLPKLVGFIGSPIICFKRVKGSLGNTITETWRL